jgi:hypothetical protein
MKTKFQGTGLVILSLLFFATPVIAAGPRQATISNVSGEAFVRLNQGEWQPASAGMVVNQNDEIKTSKGSSVEILLDEGDVGKIKIDQKSRFRIHTLDVDRATGEKSTLLDLAIGKVVVEAKRLEGDSKFEVRTPTATTGVRGTRFEVSVE